MNKAFKNILAIGVIGIAAYFGYKFYKKTRLIRKVKSKTK